MARRAMARSAVRIARRCVAAATVALVVLAVLPLGGTAHTCTPDPWVGVSGRLLVPGASGLTSIALPDRVVRSLPIVPSQGVVTSVAMSWDRSQLAVARFSRPADQQVGGQDILILGPDGGTPHRVIPRSRPGEILAAPSWLPDGSLVFERQGVAGYIAGARVERLGPGGVSTILAEPGVSPTVSPDGSLFAYVHPEEIDRLVIGDSDGGRQRVLVDNPSFVSLAFPRFSPDGAWVAFSAASDPSVQIAPPDLGAFAPLGFGLRGAMVRAHGIPWDIWIVRPDGSDLRRVTYFYDDDPSAAWSPDGRWLAILSGESVHVVSVDGPTSYCIIDQGGHGSFEWLGQ